MTRAKPARATPELIRRDAALRAVQAKYDGRAFDWKARMTCIHLLRFHLRAMGHKPPALPRIASAIGARRALRERGWDSVAAMLDSLFQRIAPAAMWPGDVAVSEGEGGLGAILISAGGDRLIGWHEDTPTCSAIAADLGALTGAWRV